MTGEAADFKHAIQNVDEDISKCEEFLCKVLNAKVNTPLQFAALQNALDNHRLMASTREMNSTTVARNTKSAKLTTPPVKLSRNIAPKNLENEFKNFIKSKKTVDKVTSRSRTTSCGSEKSLRPIPLIETEEDHSEVANLHMKHELKLKKSSSQGLLSKRSWSQLLSDNHKSSTLKVQKSDILPGTFSQFDPLRTLHFLSKELQSKLYTIAPEESSIHRILVEIQHSLHRLPVPSKSDILSGSSYSDISTTVHTQYIQSSQTCQFTQTSALAVVHQSCQTDESLQVPEKDEDLELQLMKLELTNKELTEECALAKSERDRMAETLQYHESNNNLLLAEIDELKKKLTVKDQILPRTEQIIEELKNKNKTLEEEKAALIAGYEAKLSIADETLEYVKDNKRAEYSSYMQYKLELDQKNTLINTKENQLDILTNELARVQCMVRNKMCEPQAVALVHESEDKISKLSTNIGDMKTITTASSLSTLPESAMTKSPSTRTKYLDDYKSRSDINGGSTFLSRNYDSKNRSSSRIIKSRNESSHYSLNKRNSERKYRPGSQRSPDYSLRLKASMRSSKTMDDSIESTKCNHAIADIFNKMRSDVTGCNVTLPSPPRHHKHLPDLSTSQSQWSDSM
ncbi:uncharacterized protein LOC113383435 [Ctenocephalides felis]|uniref:uncharacterized protein LOC113383435 n=1 Tax=Ctenocephalides felis TaxID=7515 RepID=UPI000E6E50A6|nr:uncharacterized protein LOC113383435 [Ctenocephalides felis]